MGIGGIETGVRDIANYLNKKNIENYILCESSDKNFNIKGLKIIKMKNLKFKNIFDQNKIKILIKDLIIKKKNKLSSHFIQSTCFFSYKFY